MVGGKMKGILCLAVLCAGSVSSLAAMHFPPRLHTPEERVRYLYFIQKRVPALFEQGAEYDIDLLGLLEREQAAINILKSVPNYEKSASERRELQTIVIEGLGRQTAKTATLNAGALAELWQQAHTIRASIAREGGSVRDLLSQAVRELSQSDPKGMVTGLIQCMPERARKDLFRLSLSEALDQMERERALSDEVIQRSFQRTAFGLSKQDIEKTALFSRIRTLIALKRLLLPLLFLDTRVDEAERTEIFEDSFRAEYFGALGTTPRQRNYLRSFWTEAQKALSSDTADTREVITDTITLREMPPYLGIFRGFVGGDCSTQMTFIFPYAPLERVYFVYDSREQIRGYIAATEILVGGRKTLYVHDIVGPTLSRRMLTLILQGLNHSKRNLGVTQISIPTEERIFENNNYEYLRQHFQAFLPDSSPVSFHYEDAQIRTVMGQQRGVDSKYDLAAANAEGHVLPEERSLEFRVTVTETPPEPIELPALSGKETISLALDLTQAVRSEAAIEALTAAVAITTNPQQINYTLRIEAAESVLKSAGMTWDSIKAITDSLLNPDNQTLDEYYGRLENDFALQGLSLEQFLSEKPYWFYEGHLKASDAFSTEKEERRKLSIEYAIHLLKRWPNPELALNAIRNNSVVFSQDIRFQNYLRSLLNDQTQDIKRLELILSYGVVPSFNEEARERLKALSKSKLTMVKRAANKYLGVAVDDTDCGERIANEG